jgi:hypothetical protein
MNVEAAAGQVNVVDAVAHDEAAQAVVSVRGRRHRRGLFHQRRLRWVSLLRRPPLDNRQQPVAPTLAVAVPVREDIATTSNHGTDRRDVGLNRGHAAAPQSTLIFSPRIVVG